jgi:hypothetical protein
LGLARLQLDIAVNVLLNRPPGCASRSEARWGSFVRQHRDSDRAGCAQPSRILARRRSADRCMGGLVDGPTPAGA